MMCLLIPGKDFDVLLEPLVEELLDLWKGVSTFDVVSRKTLIYMLRSYGVFMIIQL